MSRSLNKDVLVRLRAEDPLPVYNDISRLLTNLPANGELLEIEVLGESHALEPGVHFLQDGVAVAFPKLRIAQAFLTGRQILHRHLARDTDYVDDQTTHATSVLLLMDPEHLTAANTRKRAILSRLKSEPDPLLLLKQEMQFVDSLLTSHLHRHTKSPTLWGHRRWLLEKFIANGISIDLRVHMAQIIMVSGERHPRNYYAWDHARWLFHDPGRWNINAVSIIAIADDVKRWCFKHPFDTSGWSFLMFLMERIPDQELRLTTQEAILAETLELTESFCWVHESVWVFLRTVVAQCHGDRDSFDSFALISEKLSSDTQKPDLLGILQRARGWCDRYCLPKP